MKTFTRDYRITGDYPDQYAKYFIGMRPCILDIEATGLDPSRCKVCLVAILTRTDSGVRITQFLAENHYEENRVLSAVMDFLRQDNIDYLITFNGQAYDVPFINRRLESTFAEDRISMYDFDLYRFLSRGTDLKKRLSSLSQMSLEDHYGIFSDRRDTITGRESVALFDEYSLTGNSSIEKIILTHNREDVLQLHRLMFLSLSEPEDFDAAIAGFGFPLINGRFSVRPVLIRSKNLLRITGEQFSDVKSAAFFPDIDSPLSAEFNAASSSYKIDVPVGRHDNAYYIDAMRLGIDVSSDDNYVNGFLIFDSRTINMISGLILRKIVNEKLSAADI